MIKNDEKRIEALDNFARLMNSYGMEANRRHTSTSYPDNDNLNIVAISFESERLPVKGNKAIINRLLDDGFCVHKVMREDRHTGCSYYVFYVTKSYRFDLAK